ncbi:hypothetical protein, partial [Acidisphaera rubrifaciens]|uniref:hypothetical protein n=1 Tax=Acidisphaera rubrifaciens TaxID=50715 RepID=UPI0006620610
PTTTTPPPDAALIALDADFHRAFAAFDAIEARHGVVNRVTSAAATRAWNKTHAIRARMLSSRAATLTGAAVQAAHAWGIVDHLHACDLDRIETEDLRAYVTMLRAGLASIAAVLMAEAAPDGAPVERARLLAHAAELAQPGAVA